MSGIEDIVIAGWINRQDTYEPYLSLSRDSHSSVHSEPLMTVAQHNRIVEQYKREAERYKAIFEGNRLVVDRLIYDEKYGGQEEW